MTEAVVFIQLQVANILLSSLNAWLSPLQMTPALVEVVFFCTVNRYMGLANLPQVMAAAFCHCASLVAVPRGETPTWMNFRDCLLSTIALLRCITGTFFTFLLWKHGANRAPGNIEQ